MTVVLYGGDIVRGEVLRCEHDRVWGNPFCPDCGMKMSKLCLACKAQIRTEDRFCRYCGKEQT